MAPLALVFALPYWGHLSTCLALADALATRGGRTVFAFVYPPPRWVAREIAAHGHRCEWSLRHVRSALGRPDPAAQRQAIVAAETELVRALRPDVVVNDLRFSTPPAARAGGVPVASVLRFPFPGPLWKEAWGDFQLAPHSPAWLPLPAPDVAYCQPAWTVRTGMAHAPVERREVVAALCTAEERPGHLRLVLDAFSGLGATSIVCYPHPDEAAAGPDVVAWADLDALLAGARVLVCHAGHGLIGRAIMRGVPVVVLETDGPHVPVYSAAIEAAGAGVVVARRDQSAGAVREATRRAMDDARLRRGVGALRRAYEALPTIADALTAALEERSCLAS